MNMQSSELELKREEARFARQERFKIEQIQALRDAKLRKPLQRSQENFPEMTQKQVDKQCRRLQNEKARAYAEQFKRRYRNLLHDKIVEQIQLQEIMQKRIAVLPDGEEKTRLVGELREKEALVSGWRVEESGMAP